jgi:hypothetical protein
MISFVVGALLMALLIPLNDLILLLAKKNPKITMGIGLGMIAVDMIITLIYGFLLKNEVADNKLFIAGLLLAIFYAMIDKIKKFLKADK